ncbi:type I secretion system permease/ATPase [Nitratireductor sp. ZSWI3]|uniref:type I secretion system permease/ATPase n=1 Tax=Nitratireductor sp. ZSWI3 TaxID=2966359 RepID=UPI0021502F83|nr:type I secretion system permease/ATPase [Nitratireductor sp. ZSWI3]MCR4268617.1 type I secretion system permease/ATPase [Nitratireductor sp. ZSWI3]
MERIRSPITEASLASSAFRSAFREIALFLARPASNTVLFSDTPFDELRPTFEDVERLSARIGLEVAQHGRRDLAARSLDLPLLVLFEDGTALALLETMPDGNIRTSLAPDQETEAGVSLPEILARNIRLIVSFSIIYLNQQEGARSGTPGKIEKRHWLTSTLAPFWRSYAQVALAALFVNLLALASPLFVMNVYDRVLPNQAVATLWVLALGVAGAILFDLLLKSVRAALIDYAGRKADLKLSYLLFEKVLHSTLASRPMSTGEYANRVTQYEFVREFFTSNTLSTIIDSAFVFVFILVIYSVSGWLAVIPTTAFAVALLIGLVAQARIGRRVAAANNEAAQRQSLLVETIATIETVKSLRAERILLRRWSELAKNASRTAEGIKQLSAWAANMTQFVQQLVTVALVVAGAYEFSQGNISMGAIIATVMLSGRAVAPLGQIAMTLSRMRQALLSLRILDAVMGQPEDRPESAGFVNREVRTGDVSFKAVSFTYPGADSPALREFSLSIRGGERVGIIGRIGSGKTTIGRLMSGLYPPTAGNLLLDGVDIRQYHPSVVRSAVVFASQGADLFSGSVKENLLMAKPGATDEEIVEAARLAGVDEFVARHPKGYDMPVGERGSQLSGGQRQAVAIARLLLCKPKIVFLDEPSGAMDLASERELILKLQKAFDKDVTLVISTHRHSMLQLVDRLVVIDQGRAIADGPKDRVIAELQKNAQSARPGQA